MKVLNARAVVPGSVIARLARDAIESCQSRARVARRTAGGLREDIMSIICCGMAQPRFLKSTRPATAVDPIIALGQQVKGMHDGLEADTDWHTGKQTGDRRA